MGESSDSTTREYRERASGLGCRQGVREPVDGALTALRAHADGCTTCGLSADGSSCPEGAALWRETQTRR